MVIYRFNFSPHPWLLLLFFLFMFQQLLHVLDINCYIVDLQKPCQKGFVKFCNFGRYAPSLTSSWIGCYVIYHLVFICKDSFHYKTGCLRAPAGQIKRMDELFIKDGRGVIMVQWSALWSRATFTTGNQELMSCCPILILYFEHRPLSFLFALLFFLCCFCLYAEAFYIPGTLFWQHYGSVFVCAPVCSRRGEMKRWKETEERGKWLISF